MLSRAAENIYWMARYLERAENTVRLLSVQTETRLDHPDPAEAAWETVLGVTGTSGDFRSHGLDCSEQAVAEFLLNDPRNPSSVLGICARARENTRTLLEILPRESWEEINRLHQLTAEPDIAASRRRSEHLREIITRIQALTGLFLGGMNDDEGYAFLRLGRAIERADFATRVMLGNFHVIEHGTDDSQVIRGADWVGVLKSLTAFQMFRRAVQGPVTGPRVVRFLTCSSVFPRSIAYCTQEIRQALSRLPRSGPITEAVDRLSSRLASEFCVSAEERDASPLLAGLQSELAELHGMISADYFTLRASAPPRGQRQGQSA